MSALETYLPLAQFFAFLMGWTVAIVTGLLLKGISA